MHSQLWIYFASIVFLIMLAAVTLMFNIAFILFHFGYFNLRQENPLLPIAFFLFISVAIGTVLSFFVAKKILKPITKFSKAASNVAKGNFDVHLNETSKIKEICELSHNFNIMVTELSSIETLRNDFVVNVSHEFKTPIASIEGYATLLQDNTLTEAERNEYTQMIIESSRQLAALSGNILLLSKLENQEVLLEKELYRLDEQIRQSILMLEAAWSDKNIDLDIELPKITYSGNKNLLMQVWINLIGNAIKFSRKDGTIRITMHSFEHGIVIRISDTGCGMENSIVQHIFDKFYQGDTTRKSEGNGLGLALVKRIIDLCDGTITVTSQANEGSTFIVSLPL